MKVMRWWMLAFLAAVVLLGATTGFFWKNRTKPPPTWSPPVPRERCKDVDAPAPPLVVAAETTPLILWAAGKVRLFIDEVPTSSPPENPTRFAPGEHVLRAEAEGASLVMKFRLEPYHPALFHLELTPGAGLTAVYLGAACVSCPPPGHVTLDFTRTSATDDALLEEAATALRSGDWRAASARLRGVQPKSRQGVAFRRLVAHVYQSANQPALALQQLQKVTVNDVPTVLAAWEPLSAQELTREGTHGLDRWNLITQKFSTLLERFALEAPGPVQLATGRLADLSSGFLEATQRKDAAAQDATVKAGEEALAQFIRTLRRSRPEDCEFQTRISQSL